MGEAPTAVGAGERGRGAERSEAVADSERKGKPGDAFFIGVEAAQSAHGVLLARMFAYRAIYYAFLPTATSRPASRLHQRVHAAHTRRLAQRPQLSIIATLSPPSSLLQLPRMG